MLIVAFSASAQAALVEHRNTFQRDSLSYAAKLVLLTTLSMPRYSHTATLLYLNRFFCLLEEFIKPGILPNCVPPRVQT
jgi:hypothetical protein